MASGLLACTSCGHSTGAIAYNAKLRANEIKRRTKLEIVTISRGPRSMDAVVRRRYRTYSRTAKKHGYDSVADRFHHDVQFNEQMAAQGWTRETIGQIDEGAAEPEQRGYRTAEQIAESRREVYRGKEYATEDETWDKAYKWTASEDSEYRLWKKAKSGRGSGSWQTSYSSSSWRK